MILGNAVTYTISNKDNNPKPILLHCCNNWGAMGSGIALEIRNRIPSAYKNYLQSVYVLGSISSDDDNLVVNLVAQDGFVSGKKSISYDALVECLEKTKNKFTGHQYVIPYKMGSDRAGGDWGIVYCLCCQVLGKENILVVKL